MSVQARVRLFYLAIYGALGIYLPYFAEWFIAHGIRGLSLSFVLLLAPLGSVIAPLFIGLLSDQLGLRRSLLLAVTLLCAASLTILGVLEHAGGLTLPAAIVVLVPFALARGPMTSLAEVLTFEHGRDYGRTRLFGSIGFLGAALLGGRLLTPHSGAYVPWLAATFLFVGSLVSFSLPKASSLPPRPALRDAEELLEKNSFRVLLLVMTFILGSNSAYDVCATLKLREVGASGSEIGIFWALGTLSEIFLFFVSERVSRRFEPERLLLVAGIAASLRWLLLATISGRLPLLALQPLHALSFGCAWLAGITLLRRHAEGRGLGTAQGLFQTAISSGGVLGLLAWGPLYEIGRSRLVFLVAAIVASIGALTTLLLRENTKEFETSRQTDELELLDETGNLEAG